MDDDDGGDELGRWANRMTEVDRNGSGRTGLDAATATAAVSAITSFNISDGEDEADDERESDDSPSPVEPFSPPRKRELLRGGP